MFQLDISCEIKIPIANITLNGLINIPKNAKGLVIFVHGSGSGRLSPRNQFVANELNKLNLATLLFDLLTPEEDAIDNITREIRFNIDLLSLRLIAVTEWVLSQKELSHLNIGYFGASTGAAAALVAASKLSEIKTVVSRGGRPDLAGVALADVTAPTLFIVGGDDGEVIRLNEMAMERMGCFKRLVIIPGATHLFEEVGKLEAVAAVGSEWFLEYLG